MANIFLCVPFIQAYTQMWIFVVLNFSNLVLVTACCLVAESYLTLCDPLDSVHGVLRQEHRCGLPFPSLGYLPRPGIKPASAALAGTLGYLGSPELSLALDRKTS